MSIAPIRALQVANAGIGVGSLGLKRQRDLARAVQVLNEQNVFGADNVLTVTFDRASQRPVLRIVTRSTHELVMQLPAESVLRLYDQISRQQSR